MKFLQIILKLYFHDAKFKYSKTIRANFKNRHRILIQTRKYFIMNPVKGWNIEAKHIFVRPRQNTGTEKKHNSGNIYWLYESSESGIALRKFHVFVSTSNAFRDSPMLKY